MFLPQQLRSIFKQFQKTEGILLQSKTEIAWGGTATVSLLKYSNGWEEIEKRLLPRFQDSADGEDLIRREFEILKTFQHPFIVKAIRMNAHDRSSFVMERVHGVPLSECESFLKNLESDLRIKWIKAFANQLISVLHFLKFHRVVHGDIAPENILITQNGTIKLIDFGVARFEDDAGLPYMIAGRPFFRAPELKKSGETSYAGDVFAAGRILEWALSSISDSELEKMMKLMIEQRQLPSVFLNDFAWWNPIEIIPEMTAPSIKGERITEIELKNRWSYRYGRFLKPITICFMLIFLSSWLPQKAFLSVNSLPYSHFTIDQMPDEIFETPAINVPVRSGEMVVSFVIPNQNNRRVIRKIKIKPLEQAKLFEDFKIIDKF